MILKIGYLFVSYITETECILERSRMIEEVKLSFLCVQTEKSFSWGFWSIGLVEN